MNIPEEMIPLILEALYTHRWQAIRKMGQAQDSAAAIEQVMFHTKDAQACAEAVVFIKKALPEYETAHLVVG